MRQLQSTKLIRLWIKLRSLRRRHASILRITAWMMAVAVSMGTAYVSGTISDKGANPQYPMQNVSQLKSMESVKEMCSLSVSCLSWCCRYSSTYPMLYLWSLWTKRRVKYHGGRLWLMLFAFQIVSGENKSRTGILSNNSRLTMNDILHRKL